MTTQEVDSRKIEAVFAISAFHFLLFKVVLDIRKKNKITKHNKPSQIIKRK